MVPTLLTLGNAACGLASASFAAHADSGQTWPLIAAGSLIFLAMVFDALDGGAARLLRQTSRFGGELESLCDAVSFGVAPALLLLRLGPDFHPAFLWPIAALFLMAVLLRLARFNLESEADDQHEWFTGLPSPAAGGLIASLAIAAAAGWPAWLPTVVLSALPPGESVFRITSNAAPCLALLLAALMVSHFRYPHLVSQWLRGRWRAAHWLVLVAAVFSSLAIGAWIGPLVLAVFTVAAPLRALWLYLARTTENAPPRPVFSRFRARARRGEISSATDNPNSPATEKRADDRQRLTKARKVRM